MNRKIIFSFIVFCFCLRFSLFADEMMVGGYGEYSVTQIWGSEEIISDLALFRIESEYETDRTRLQTHIILSQNRQPLDFSIYYKKNSLIANLYQSYYDLLLMGLEQQGIDFGQIYELGLQPLNFLSYSNLLGMNTVLLDRLAIQYRFKKVDLTLGKQQIAWGSGYGFNPTDLWNIKSPTDVDAVKRGVSAIRAEIPLGRLSGLDCIVVPGLKNAQGSIGARFKSHLGGYDYSFSLAKFADFDHELLDLPQKVMFGFDFVGETFFDWGIWSEIAMINPKYSDMDYSDMDSLFVQADLGIDYTFENGVYYLLEYYHNGLGTEDYQDYNLQSVYHTMVGDMSGFAKNYFMTGITKDFFYDYQFSLFSLVNIDDQSLMVLPQLNYNFSSDFIFELKANINLGDKKKTEFGSMGNSLSFRGVGYF